jgi:glucose/mannose-6-phosphate isomerase
MTSGILDEPDALRRLDRSDMLAAVAALPADLADGWARTRGVTLPSAHRAATSIAVLGMGGSAIAGDIVAGVFSDRLTRPLTVVRDYELPAFVGPSTLIVASSFSGATEETIASLHGPGRHCPVIVVTTGGPLLEVARRAELPYLAFEGSGQPRAALGRSAGILAGLLERAGMLALDDDEVAGAVAAAQVTVSASRPAVNMGNEAAAGLGLIDRLPTIGLRSGAGGTAENAAQRERQDGRDLGGYPGRPTTRRRLRRPRRSAIGWSVFLASRDEHPRNSRRAKLASSSSRGHRPPGTNRPRPAGTGDGASCSGIT